MQHGLFRPAPLTPLRRLSRCLPLRQRSQNVVEFGLSIAAVAFVALLGFSALGHAQAAYWGGPEASTLAKPAPVVGEFTHQTTVSGSCSPTTLPAGATNTLSCNIRVDDAFTPPPGKKGPPRGTVQIVVDSRTALFPTCTLTPDAGGQPFSTCVFSPTWTTGVGDVGGHSLVATYAPDMSDNGVHLTGALTPPQAVSVLATVAITWAPDATHGTPCSNAYTIPGFTLPGQFEQGHPVTCHLKVTDPTGGTGYKTAPIQITDSLGSTPASYLSCFTKNQMSALPTCSNPGPVFVANTDTNGDLWFVYRRYAEVARAIPLTFIAQSMVYPSVGATLCATACSQTQQLTVEPPVAGPHNVDILVDCPSNVTATYAWASANGQSVQTVDVLRGTAGALVTCTVVVFDTDQAFFNGLGNPDTVDIYAPSGTINWVDELGNPVKDQKGNNAVCNALDPTISSPSNYKALQYHGIPSDAGGCQTTLRLSGDHIITARFNPTVAALKGHKAIDAHAFTSSFD